MFRVPKPTPVSYARRRGLICLVANLSSIGQDHELPNSRVIGGSESFALQVESLQDNWKNLDIACHLMHVKLAPPVIPFYG
jgi:hypothetical protein